MHISRTTIEYAHARAHTQGLDNATFIVMDVTRPLEFPDACFDLVNARLLVSVLSTEAWLPLLRECVRVTRPGGLIRLTECERSISTSPANPGIRRRTRSDGAEGSIVMASRGRLDDRHARMRSIRALLPVADHENY